MPVDRRIALTAGSGCPSSGGATPKRTREARLRRIVDALKVAVPQLSKLHFERDERGSARLKGRYEHWRPQGAWQDQDRLSDGTLRLPGLLWVVLDGTGPLLLEEPELSLQPDVVRHLPQLFARVQRRSGRQMLISTHSADILRDEGIGLDEVVLLRPDPEGTTVELATEIAQAQTLLAGGSSLADVVLPPYATCRSGAARPVRGSVTGAHRGAHGRIDRCRGVYG